MSTFQTIVNSIMSKIPVRRLRQLRIDLEGSREGLTLEEFVDVAIRNMELEDETQLLLTVPELVDLFGVIDVNGDGSLEWSEFVSFLIEQVLQTGFPSDVYERIHNAPSEETNVTHKSTVHCCRVIIGKLFVACGKEIQIHSLDPQSSTWLSSDTATISIECPESLAECVSLIDVTILDIAFIASSDILILLRSDKRLHAIRLTTRTKLTSDSVFYMGSFLLPLHCSRIVIREVPKEPYKLIACGASPIIHSWTLLPLPSGIVQYTDYQELPAVHTDFVRDLLIVTEGLHRLLVSASLDRTCVTYDLSTLKPRSVKTSPSNGIRCLAQDNRGMLLAGCLDYTIVAWDLESELDLPLFTLRGHESVVVKIVAIDSRCFSLDQLGEIRYWYIGDQREDEDRLIDSKHPVDRPLSFDVFTGVSPIIDSVNNTIIAATGRLMHMYKVIDTSPLVEAPIAVLLSQELLTIATVHAFDIFLWNAVSGLLICRVPLLRIVATEVTSAALNCRGHKLLCGDSSGVLHSFNCFNGAYLASVSVTPSSAIRFIAGTPDRMVFILHGQSDLAVVDDGDGFSSGVLRANRVPDRYAVGMAYSAALGVVALADSRDNILIFDGEFLSLELTVPSCTGAKVGAIEFIEHYPLLLICSNAGGFIVLPVMLHKARVPIWRVAVESEVKPEVKSRGFSILDVAAKRSVRCVKCLIAKRGSEEVEESVYKRVLRQSFGDMMETMNAASSEHKSVSYSIKVLVGYDDGVIGAFRFDNVIESINVSRIDEADWSINRAQYNNRRRGDRDTTDFSLERTSLIRSTTKRSERRSYCTLLNMWQAHSNSVVSIVVFRNTSMVLSGSEDQKVILWSSNGDQKGILTRGLKADLVFSLAWTSPVDVVIRQQEKIELAQKLREKLNLKVTLYDSTLHQSHSQIAFSEKNVDSTTSEKIKNRKLISMLSGSLCELCDLSDRVRVIGQLNGAVTYQLSVKDSHKSIIGSTEAHLKRTLTTLQLIYSRKGSSSKQSKKQKRKSKNSPPQVVTNEDGEYMESIIQQTIIDSGDASQSHFKTKFDAEIQRFEAKDPSNWDLSSLNRQSQIYSNLFRELKAKGLSKDQIALLQIKLNALSPGGDFAAYMTFLRDKNSEKITTARTQKLSLPSCRRESPRVPSLDLQLFKSSCISQSNSSIKMSTISNSVDKSSKASVPPNITTKLRPIQGTQFQNSLPKNMSPDLPSDLVETYEKNHGETVSAYERFVNDMKRADTTYRKARKAHRRGRRKVLLRPICNSVVSL